MTRRENPGWATHLASMLNQQVPVILEESMRTRVEHEAKRLVTLGHPNYLERKTGRLQDSITTEVFQADMSATVGTNLIYGPVHEFGAVITDRYGTTRFIPPRPFLVPAFEAQKNDLAADFRRGFHEIVEEIALT